MMFRVYLCTWTFVLLAITFSQSELASARLVEEAEFNPKAAAELYSKAALRPGASPAEQAEALVRLARCLVRLGRNDEAKLAWQKAATLEGPFSEEAREVVSGRKSPVDQDLDERIRRARMQLAGDEKVSRAAATELLLIGRPAVRILADAIENDRNPDTDVLRAVRLLIEIGGPEAAEFLERVRTKGSDLIRRTVARAFCEEHSGTGGAPLPPGQNVEPLASTLRGFLKDRDPAIRVMVLAHYYHSERAITADELKSAIEDNEGIVRARALELAKSRNRQMPGMNNFAEWVISYVDRAMNDADPRVAQVAQSYLQMPSLPATREGLELVLKYLHVDFDVLNFGWPSNVLSSLVRQNNQPLPAERAPSFVAVRSALQKLIEHQTITDLRLEQRWVVLFKIASAFQSHWTRNELMAFIEAVAANPPLSTKDNVRYAYHECENFFFYEFATPSEIDLALRLLEKARTFTLVAGWLRKQKIPEILNPRVFRIADSAAESVRTGESGKTHWTDLLQILVTINTEEARNCLRKFSAAGSKWRVFEAVSLADPAQIPIEYLKEVMMDCADLGPENGVGQLRRQALLWFWMNGTPDVIPCFTLAYRSRMREPGQTQHPPLILGNIREDEFGIAFRTPTRYSPAQLAEIIDSILTPQYMFAWEDTTRFVYRYERQGLPIPAEITEVLARHLALVYGTPFENNAFTSHCIKHFDHNRPGVQDMVRKILSAANDRAAPRILSDLLQAPDAARHYIADITERVNNGDSSLVNSGLKLLVRAQDPAVSLKAKKLIESQEARTRQYAMDVLVELKDPAAARIVESLLTDPEALVRQGACEAAAILLDVQLVPKILARFQDTESKVREAAQNSLAAIDRYYQMKGRWEKVLSGSGLNAESAAEALLHLAQKGSAEQRIVAIQSLGTLKAAETLPFLINLLSDPDAAVQSAARQAIEKINR